MLRRLVDGRRTLNGDDNFRTLEAPGLLDQFQDYQGFYVEDKELHRRALEGIERVLRSEHPERFISTSNLGCILGGQGRYQSMKVYKKWRGFL